MKFDSIFLVILSPVIFLATANTVIGQTSADSIAVMRSVGADIRKEGLGSVSVSSAIRCGRAGCGLSVSEEARLVGAFAVGVNGIVEPSGAPFRTRYKLRTSLPRFSGDSASVTITYVFAATDGEAGLRDIVFELSRERTLWRVASKRLSRIS